jgi:putative transposase
MLWSMPTGDSDYATRIRLAKTSFTKSLSLDGTVAPLNISRVQKGERDVWQRRCWEHTIRDERDFQMRLDYIQAQAE